MAETEVNEPLSNKRELVGLYVKPKNSLAAADSIYIRLEQEQAYQIAERYFDAIKGGSTEDPLANEVEFLLRQKGITDEFIPKCSPIRTRTLYSEIAALYYLFVGRGLDDLYSQWLKIETEKGTLPPDNPEEIMEVRLNLAANYLEVMRNKNKEEKMAAADQNTVTMGFEIEFYDFARSLLKKEPELESELVQLRALLPSQAGRERERTRRRVSQLKKLLAFSVYLRGEDLDSEAAAGNLEVYPTRVSVLGESDLYQESAGDYVEISNRPASSPRTAMREFLHIMLSGGLLSAWGVHETFGGVTLNHRRTEFMDGLAIAAAAGLVAYPKENAGETGLGENCVKASYQNELGYFYFPFHKLRDFGELSDKRFAKYPRSRPATAVELRSVLRFEESEFPRFVRQVTFHYLFACGVKAFQTEEAQRTPQQQALVANYLDLVSGWQQLLDKYRTRNIKNSDKFIVFPDYTKWNAYDNMRSHPSPYGRFINKLMEKSHNREFRSEAKKLVSLYSKKAKTIIGY